MKRTMRCVLAIVLALVMLLPAISVPGRAAGEVTRIYGADRYATSLKTADVLKRELGGAAFQTVVVASGGSFADALSGSYLAAVKNAPILLVSDGRIQQVKSYIDENLAEDGTVYLLGGKNAVSEKVENSLQQHHVVRLAGETRYATNIKILQETGLGGQEVLICTGKDFADSLSASAVGLPIMLVGNRLTDEQLDMLSNAAGVFTIIGGTGAVSKGVEAQLENLGSVSRLGGNTRYETSVMVAKKYFESPTLAVLAYAKNFPDGLSGGPLAYVKQAPMILTNTGKEAAAAGYTNSYAISDGYVLGGPGLISEAAVAKIFVGKQPEPSVPQETPYSFAAGDFITQDKVQIETDSFVYHIGKGVFVPGHIEQLSDTLAGALEKATGLKIAGKGYAKDVYSDDRIHVSIDRSGLSVIQSYTGVSELGPAYASAKDHATISPGELYLYQYYSVVHEAAHVIRFKQSGWSFDNPLEEGFAAYTTYRVLADLEKTDPAAAYYLGTSASAIWDMSIQDYGPLYEKPIEHWLEYGYEYSGNQNYCVGFRFMWYLQEVYGDYSRWITEYEAAYPSAGRSDLVSMNSVIKILKKTYGADVLTGFYPWLKQNEALFEDAPQYEKFSDMTQVQALNLYPKFQFGASCTELTKILYRDLYVNLETAYTYLEDYKQIDISSLTLYNPDGVTINLYRADGTYTTSSGETEISLEGIRYIKLVGSGQLSKLQIHGYPYCTEGY